MGIASSLEKETLLSSCGFIPPSALDDPLQKRIDRSPRIDSASEVSDPSGSIDILVGPTLKQCFVVPIDHPFAVSQVGQKSIHPTLPSALERLSKKCVDLLDRWDCVS
jgi:hypothetical protein